jgi:hypothetical protein
VVDASVLEIQSVSASLGQGEAAGHQEQGKTDSHGRTIESSRDMLGPSLVL